MARKFAEFDSRLYTGDDFVADVAISLQKEDPNIQHMFQQEMRVTKFTQPSERCLPLQVLHTIVTAGVCLKMCASQQQQPIDSQNLENLHTACLKGAKVT